MTAGDRGPARRGRPAARRGAGPRPAAAAQFRLARAAGRARLRHRQLLRGRARGRWRLLRPVPPAPSRSPAQRGDRRRHRQGHRRGIADGVRPAAPPRRDRPHDRPGRGARAHEPDPRRRAALVAVHHRARAVGSTSGRATCASRTRATNRHCSIRADGSPPTWLEGAGPLVGAFNRLDVPEITVELDPGDLALLYTDGDHRCAVAARRSVRRVAPARDHRGRPRRERAAAGRPRSPTRSAPFRSRPRRSTTSRSWRSGGCRRAARDDRSRRRPRHRAGGAGI